MVTNVEKEDIGMLIARIGELRSKQLNTKDGLSDEECKEGIRLLAQVRVMRAGKSAVVENSAAQSLSDMF